MEFSPALLLYEIVKAREIKSVRLTALGALGWHSSHKYGLRIAA